MMPDNSTNYLYLADTLPIKHRDFYARFVKILKECKIDFEPLQHTKDIWAVDFMPIQISKDRFVQFRYDPDYLKPKKYWKNISDVDSICKAINIHPFKSNLVVDGGNISRTTDMVIMCDKVFHENKDIPEKELIKQLKELFEVNHLLFVPWNKYDYTGHADGMVRFIDCNTVLINDYSKEDARYQRAFRMSLHNAGLDWVELPYEPTKNMDSAEGIYLNYLQMEQAIIVPIFNMASDETTVKIIQDVFPGQRIATIEANEIAKEGGILNCITWNILK